MSIHNPIESLASIENGSDVISYLLDSEGLNYSSFVEVPSGINRNQGRNDWYEAHLVDADSKGIIRYIELGASGDNPSFSELKRQLKRHGSPIDELFTIVAYRKSDEGPLISPLNGDLTFLYIEEQFSSEDVEVTFDLKYFTVDRFDVEPAYIDFVEDIAVGSGQGRTSLERHIEDVFSIREITRSFYEEFGQLFRETLQDAIHGLEVPEENLNAYTRTVVNRVLFLLFVEEKGWLDDDADYIENKYETAKANEAMHVYDDFFEPLFFEALSDTTATDYGFLGRIPFLNGGLFERRDIETDVCISEEFFDVLLSPEEDESGVPKGFLRRYKISLRESNPSEQELVVDPEFIGRIFEMFMQDDERSEVGAFYTPKSITAYITKNALKQHLLRKTDISHDEAVSLVSDHSTPGSLSEGQIEAVNDALSSATVLDPAVGSGAFIIGMLEELVAVSETLDKSSGDDRSRFQLKEEFIADTLYGVDIDAGGVELCKFRVWLHLMQDLDVDHEEFLDANEKFALPNLGFKFFVGNSLVGEHDPTNVDAQQSTLAGGLDETLENIHEVRTEYQTSHGEEKDRLSERLDELTAELDTQLAVEQSDWMNDVAAETEETFAWTTNIPEVILDGGFDMVIGNPPYEGQSKQDYIGELARFYDEEYDFYKTIPRMRHDLYQKFNIRGWELTQEGGILSFITSNTFYTIGSKQTTRNLLQNNKVLDLLQANPNTFDATVNPAIFSMQKTESPSEYCFNYIEAAHAETDGYRSLVGELSDAADSKLDAPVQLASKGPSSIRVYRVPIEIYRNSLRHAFFEPTDENMEMYESVIADATEMSKVWGDEIRDSDTLDENLDSIRKNHLNSLSPGDVSILGLLTVGGQGLATGSNDDYLAYLDGTQGAGEIKKRNEDFQYESKNETQYKWMSQVVRPENTVNAESLSKIEKQDGINNSRSDTWVPIIKGKGDTYYTPITEYIDWSKDSIAGIEEDGLIRNQRYYFEEGVFISRGGTGEPVIRYSPPAAVDSSGGIYIPTYNQVSAKYLNGLLNSEHIQHLINTFINSTVNTQIQDMRLVPIVIPSDEQLDRMEELVEEAIGIRIREMHIESPVAQLDTTAAPSRELSDVEAEINQLVLDIYNP